MKITAKENDETTFFQTATIISAYAVEPEWSINALFSLAIIFILRLFSTSTFCVPDIGGLLLVCKKSVKRNNTSIEVNKIYRKGTFG